MRVLVTGANGFIGSAVCEELLARDYVVTAAARQTSEVLNPHKGRLQHIVIKQIGPATDWHDALQGVEAVIHLAARVHIMDASKAESLALYREVNVDGTQRLARQAAAAGVNRFIYLSSIKVNGESTDSSPFSEQDIANPQDNYAISKWEAEQILRQVGLETGMEIVILRSPLVYGARVGANFERLLNLVSKGIPMPFASVHNKRAFVYIGNLVDALFVCLSHSAAAGETFLVSDGQDISTQDMARMIALNLRKQPRLWPIPVVLLRAVAMLVGKGAELDKLVKSLQVDISKICSKLDWAPPYSIQQGLQETVSWEAREAYFSPEPNRMLSVIIVNYNAGEVLSNTVRFLNLAGKNMPLEIIVVDNDSQDDSIALMQRAQLGNPQLRVIHNRKNLGFSAACNIGKAHATGAWLLFLNPDCEIEVGAIETMLACMKSEPRIGMIGGLLLNPDGTEQIGSRRAVPTPWRSLVRVLRLSGWLSERYPRLFVDFQLHKEPLPDAPIEVEAISGACMLVRRAALEDVGPLDEGYFMHCEDLDWCMRFRQANWKIMFVPGARIVHHKGTCSRSRPIFIEWHKHKGMVRFYKKFFYHQYPGILMILVVIGVWLRFSAKFFYLLGRRLRPVT